MSARKWEFGFHSWVCATQACHCHRLAGGVSQRRGVNGCEEAGILRLRRAHAHFPLHVQRTLTG